MNNLRRGVSITAAMFLLAAFGIGCTTVEKVAQTRSGKPEVFLMGVPEDEARDRLVNRLLDKGWTPMEEASSYGLTFRRAPQGFAQEFAAELMAGGDYRGDVEMRVTFTLLYSGGGTRIVADYPYLTSKHAIFGTENKSVLDGNEMFNEMYEMLQDLRYIEDPTM